jgi:hypothetical protein
MFVECIVNGGLVRAQVRGGLQQGQLDRRRTHRRDGPETPLNVVASADLDPPTAALDGVEVEAVA